MGQVGDDRHPTGVCGDEYCRCVLARPGAYPQVLCVYCGVRGGCVIETRAEYRDVPVDAGKEERLVDGCRACPSRVLSLTTRLTVTGHAQVAGVAVKLAATEVPAARCPACERMWDVRFWSWMVCGSCGHQSRGRR
jgi:hypothetical protein